MADYYLERRRPQSQRVVAGTLSFHYLAWDGNEDLTVLMLHPRRGNAHHWDLMADHLRWRGRLIAPDMRGHGLSEWPGVGYDVEQHARDVLALMDVLHLKRCVLVGAATGGNLALLLASEHPERIVGIVVVDAGVGIPATVLAQTAKEIENAYEFPNFDAARDSLLFASLWPAPVRDYFALHSFRPVEGGRWAWAWDRDAARGIGNTIQRPIWDRIAVTCPAMMVRGIDSQVFLSEHLERLKGLIPQAQLACVPGSDHMPAQDNPPFMAALLERFLPDCFP